jgi:tetraacyldisaccharide 4'-kinase
MRKILFPFAVLYDAITCLRNRLYDARIYKPFQFDVLTVGVGNLSVGGTGKSPHVEYIIELLKDDFSIATLSRGYGRKSKGFQLAGNAVDVKLLGDEPAMFKLKYPSIPVAVAENRVMGVTELLGIEEQVNLVVLDDVFQHRAIHPHIQIMLSKFDDPFYSDFLLPAGNLRESRKGAQRADIIIVSKCPLELDSKQKEQIIYKIRKYNKEAPIYFSSFVYGQLKSVFGDDKHLNMDNGILAFAGIADPTAFFAELKKNFDATCISFSDHHNFTSADLEDLRAKSSSNRWVCTEKDMVKLQSFKKWFADAGISLNYLPIKVQFNDSSFDRQFIELIGGHRNSINED